MEYYPFDSRNKLYRNIIGAVAEDTTLRLRLLLSFEAKCTAAFLVIRNDNDLEPVEILLTKGETIGNYQVYECEIELYEGLYWYAFKYRSEYGEFYVTKTEDSLGTVSKDGAWWQQTVYKKDFNVPEWIKGGIIYQIFPDRFYNSGAKKDNIPEDRYIVKEWNKVPEHRQNNGDCSLGNDYYCGDLKGIEEKLPYLKSLGVSVVYLNPIFEAHSNHRYNTADYFRIDPILGNEADLISLCEKAEKSGIKVILDGVFSHTGADSVYFNSNQRYDSLGAANSHDSPYFSWYKFKSYPHDYEAWWGVKTLPEVNENDPYFTEFITGENGVLGYWLKKGIGGWRLDVADELPDEFLDNIRKAVKRENPDAYILGEVWEDASNKISYGSRRRFLRGSQLDSVMNYPFADAIIEFILNADSKKLVNTVLDICENYPKASIDSLMNHIGTHDTMRILTRLAADNPNITDRNEQAKAALSDAQLKNGIKKVMLAAVIQYTLPGVPSLYYGDEIGLQGFGDPFCRGSFDWSRTDCELTKFYKKLGKVRRACTAYKDGEFIPILSDGGFLAFERTTANGSALTVVNNTTEEKNFNLPQKYKNGKANLKAKIKNGIITVPPFSAEIVTV